jgi:hypothetical protein
VLDLTLLQYLQRAGLDDKQNAIIKLGFDLRSSVEKDGIAVHRYYRCWYTTRNQTAIYDQVLMWDLGTNSLVYLMRDRHEYDSLRNSIESRHGNSGGNLDFYAGKMFFYRFGSQLMDGEEYFSVSIAFR